MIKLEYGLVPLEVAMCLIVILASYYIKNYIERLLMTEQIINLLEIVPSIVILLAAVFFIFVVSLHDLESSILPANSKKLFFYSMATMCFYLLGFLLGAFFVYWEIMKEFDMSSVSVAVLLIVSVLLIALILASKNHNNLFKDKIFSVFKKNSSFFFVLVILPFLLGFFSYFIMANDKLETMLVFIFVLISLLLFIGKASVHNGLDDSLRMFYFKDYELLNESQLKAYLISENESFFFVVPFIEDCTCCKKCNENKAREKKKDKSIIAVNKSLVSYYEIASLKNIEDKVQ